MAKLAKAKKKEQKGDKNEDVDDAASVASSEIDYVVSSGEEDSDPITYAASHLGDDAVECAGPDDDVAFNAVSVASDVGDVKDGVLGSIKSTDKKSGPVTPCEDQNNAAGGKTDPVQAEEEVEKTADPVQEKKEVEKTDPEPTQVGVAAPVPTEAGDADPVEEKEGKGEYKSAKSTGGKESRSPEKQEEGQEDAVAVADTPADIPATRDSTLAEGTEPSLDPNNTSAAEDIVVDTSAATAGITSEPLGVTVEGAEDKPTPAAPDTEDATPTPKDKVDDTDAFEKTAVLPSSTDTPLPPNALSPEQGGSPKKTTRAEEKEKEGEDLGPCNKEDVLPMSPCTRASDASTNKVAHGSREDIMSVEEEGAVLGAALLSPPRRVSPNKVAHQNVASSDALNPPALASPAGNGMNQPSDKKKRTPPPLPLVGTSASSSSARCPPCGVNEMGSSAATRRSSSSGHGGDGPSSEEEEEEEEDGVPSAFPHGFPPGFDPSDLSTLPLGFFPPGFDVSKLPPGLMPKNGHGSRLRRHNSASSYNTSEEREAHDGSTTEEEMDHAPFHPSMRHVVVRNKKLWTRLEKLRGWKGTSKSYVSKPIAAHIVPLPCAEPVVTAAESSLITSPFEDMQAKVEEVPVNEPQPQQKSSSAGGKKKTRLEEKLATLMVQLQKNAAGDTTAGTESYVSTFWGSLTQEERAKVRETLPAIAKLAPASPTHNTSEEKDDDIEIISVPSAPSAGREESKKKSSSTNANIGAGGVVQAEPVEPEVIGIPEPVEPEVIVIPEEPVRAMEPAPPAPDPAAAARVPKPCDPTPAPPAPAQAEETMNVVCTLRIQDLPPGTKAHQLGALFANYKVVSVSLMKPKKAQSLVGFVRLADKPNQPVDPEKVREEIDGKEIMGQKMKVSLEKKKKIVQPPAVSSLDTGVPPQQDEVPPAWRERWSFLFGILKISMSNLNLTDADIRKWAQWVPQVIDPLIIAGSILKNSIIDFSGNQITDIGCQQIFHVLHNFGIHSAKLKFGSNLLTDQSINNFVTYLMNNMIPTHELWIEKNRFTVKGIVHLCRTLKTHQHFPRYDAEQSCYRSFRLSLQHNQFDANELFALLRQYDISFCQGLESSYSSDHAPPQVFLPDLPPAPPQWNPPIPTIPALPHVQVLPPHFVAPVASSYNPQALQPSVEPSVQPPAQPLPNGGTSYGFAPSAQGAHAFLPQHQYPPMIPHESNPPHDGGKGPFTSINRRDHSPSHQHEPQEQQFHHEPPFIEVKATGGQGTVRYHPPEHHHQQHQQQQQQQQGSHEPLIPHGHTSEGSKGGSRPAGYTPTAHQPLPHHPPQTPPPIPSSSSSSFREVDPQQQGYHLQLLQQAEDADHPPDLGSDPHHPASDPYPDPASGACPDSTLSPLSAGSDGAGAGEEEDVFGNQQNPGGATSADADDVQKAHAHATPTGAGAANVGAHASNAHPTHASHSGVLLKKKQNVSVRQLQKKKAILLPHKGGVKGKGEKGEKGENTSNMNNNGKSNHHSSSAPAQKHYGSPVPRPKSVSATATPVVLPPSGKGRKGKGAGGTAAAPAVVQDMVRMKGVGDGPAPQSYRPDMVRMKGVGDGPGSQSYRPDKVKMKGVGDGPGSQSYRPDMVKMKAGDGGKGHHNQGHIHKVAPVGSRPKAPSPGELHFEQQYESGPKGSPPPTPPPKQQQQPKPQPQPLVVGGHHLPKTTSLLGRNARQNAKSIGGGGGRGGSVAAVSTTSTSGNIKAKAAPTPPTMLSGESAALPAPRKIVGLVKISAHHGSVPKTAACLSGAKNKLSSVLTPLGKAKAKAQSTAAMSHARPKEWTG